MRYLDDVALSKISNKLFIPASMNESYEKNLKIELCYLLWKRTTDSKGFYNDLLYKKVLEKILYGKSDDLFDTIIGEEVFDEESCVSLANEIEKNKRSHKYEEDLCPVSIIEAVKKLLDINSNESFCDFGCGSGKLLLNFSQSFRMSEKNVSLNGYEINYDKSVVAECLLEMNKVCYSIKNQDFLQNNDNCKFDKGFVFPPFGIRYSIEQWDKLAAGYRDLFTSRIETELLFIFKALEHIKENGKLIALVPTGPAFRKSAEKARKYFCEKKLIEGVISLPGGLLDFTAIPVDLWIFSKKNNNGIKFLNASGMKIKGKSPRDNQLDYEKTFSEYMENSEIIDSLKIAEYDYSFSQNAYSMSEFLSKIPNPVHITDVCKIEKGSQYTISRFKDQISDTKTNYQILTIASIQNEIVDFDSLPFIQEDEKLLKFKLEENDIIVTSKSTVIKTFVAQNLPERNIIVSGGMIIIRPDLNKINPTYLKMFLDSEIGRKELNSFSNVSLIITISQSLFKDRMIIPCPPLEKQNDLADNYNNLLWMINAMNKQISEMNDQLSNMFEESLEESE